MLRSPVGSSHVNLTSALGDPAGGQGQVRVQAARAAEVLDRAGGLRVPGWRGPGVQSRQGGAPAQDDGGCQAFNRLLLGGVQHVARTFSGEVWLSY